MSDETWFTFFALLTVAANVGTFTLWTLALARRWSPGARAWHERVAVSLGEGGLALGALVAGTATAGSLWLSEGVGFVPCKLCWYQRIGMYPLAVLLLVAAVRRDWHVRPFALVLALATPLISAYHYLLQRFPSLESGVSCDPFNPCTTTLIWKFHYVSIPFMALSAFAFVATILLVARPPDSEVSGHGRDHGAAAREAR